MFLAIKMKYTLHTLYTRTNKIFLTH